MAVGLGISQVLLIIAHLQLRVGHREWELAIVGLALVAGLYGGIVRLVLWYKMWAAIQDGHARTTPGKAIGFLFIPVFNIYWVFQAVWGFSKDCNKYIKRHGIPTERLFEGLFLAYVILGFMAWIPALRLPLTVLTYFMLLVLTSEVCDAVNAIAAAPARQTSEMVFASVGAATVPTGLTGVPADLEKERRGLRLVLRCSALTIGALLALPIFGWSWTPMVLPSLSPHILICSAVAGRPISLPVLIGLPVFAVVLVRRRWFCRYACPVGLITEQVSRLRPSAKSIATRLPPLGRCIVLLTLGGACLGYPLFLWMDPLAMFQGILALRHEPLSVAAWVPALALAAVLSLSLLIPNAWCLRVCPLGATQDLLALPRRWLRRKESSSPRPDGGRPLSRRSVLSVAFGTVCVGLGAGWGAVASNRSPRKGSKLTRPPGSVDEGCFPGLCIRCGNCLRACPAGIIQPDLGSQGIAAFLTPVIRFHDDYCREDCHRCTQVCPSGAIARLSLEEKQKTPIGLAKVDTSLCLLTDDRECDICARVCPYEAIEIAWCEEEYIATVRVDPARCPGCGACEVSCPGTNEPERREADAPIPLRKAIQVCPVRP